MDEEQEIVQAVLDSYGLRDAGTHLLGSLWNHVYRVEAEAQARLQPPAVIAAIRETIGVEGRPPAAT